MSTPESTPSTSTEDGREVLLLSTSAAVAFALLLWQHLEIGADDGVNDGVNDGFEAFSAVTLSFLALLSLTALALFLTQPSDSWAGKKGRKPALVLAAGLALVLTTICVVWAGSLDGGGGDGFYVRLILLLAAVGAQAYFAFCPVTAGVSARQPARAVHWTPDLIGAKEHSAVLTILANRTDSTAQNGQPTVQEYDTVGGGRVKVYAPDPKQQVDYLIAGKGGHNGKPQPSLVLHSTHTRPFIAGLQVNPPFHPWEHKIWDGQAVETNLDQVVCHYLPWNSPAFQTWGLGDVDPVLELDNFENECSAAALTRTAAAMRRFGSSGKDIMEHLQKASEAGHLRYIESYFPSRKGQAPLTDGLFRKHGAEPYLNWPNAATKRHGNLLTGFATTQTKKFKNWTIRLKEANEQIRQRLTHSRGADLARSVDQGMWELAKARRLETEVRDEDPEILRRFMTTLVCRIYREHEEDAQKRDAEGYLQERGFRKAAALRLAICSGENAEPPSHCEALKNNLDLQTGTTPLMDMVILPWFEHDCSDLGNEGPSGSTLQRAYSNPETYSAYIRAKSLDSVTSHVNSGTGPDPRRNKSSAPLPMWELSSAGSPRVMKIRQAETGVNLKFLVCIKTLSGVDAVLQLLHTGGANSHAETTDAVVVIDPDSTAGFKDQRFWIENHLEQTQEDLKEKIQEAYNQKVQANTSLGEEDIKQLGTMPQYFGGSLADTLRLYKDDIYKSLGLKDIKNYLTQQLNLVKKTVTKTHTNEKLLNEYVDEAAKLYMRQIEEAWEKYGLEMTKKSQLLLARMQELQLQSQPYLASRGASNQPRYLDEGLYLRKHRSDRLILSFGKEHLRHELVVCLPAQKIQ